MGFHFLFLPFVFVPLFFFLFFFIKKPLPNSPLRCFTVSSSEAGRVGFLFFFFFVCGAAYEKKLLRLQCRQTFFIVSLELGAPKVAGAGETLRRVQEPGTSPGGCCCEMGWEADRRARCVATCSDLFGEDTRE